jgi:hypothetical protein
VTPPTEGFYFFRGVRVIRNNQRVFVDEPVCVCYEYHGAAKTIGVMMLGRQTHYRLESFDGDWQPLEVTP